MPTVITLTDGADTYRGSPDDETILALDGNDEIDGAAGADSIDGGGGNDTLTDSGASIQLSGGAGTDVLQAGVQPDGPAEPGVEVSAQAVLVGGGDADRLTAVAALPANPEFFYYDAALSLQLAGDGGDDVLRTEAQMYEAVGVRLTERLAGGIGDDQLTCWNRLSTLYATVEITLDGGDGADRLTADVAVTAAQANVRIEASGGAGNDEVTAGTGGTVVLDGGDGDDTLTGRAGQSTQESKNVTGYTVLEGGRGDDVIVGEIELLTYPGNVLAAGSNRLDGGDGNDQLYASAFLVEYGGDGPRWATGENVLSGGNGDDLLSVFGGGTNTLDGGAGLDTASFARSSAGGRINLGDGRADVDGASTVLIGIENVIGTQGADSITGSALANRLDGGAGNDTIESGAGNDELVGGDGDDLLLAGLGTDSYYGVFGNDTLSFAARTTGANIDLAWGRATVGGVVEVVSGIENMIGSQGADSILGSGGANAIDGGAGNDTLDGGAGDDTLTGGDGNDLLYTRSGADQFFGGNGYDTLSLAREGSAGRVDLAAGRVSVGGVSETLSSIENVIGSAGDDVIIGSATANQLRGGAGSDTLTGGGGYDRFEFYGLGNGTDRITDFVDGVDRVMIAGYGAALDSFADLNISVVSGDTWINLDADVAGAGVIVLVGVTTGLDATDFVFA